MIALNGEVIKHRKALGPIPSAEENISILKYGDLGVVTQPIDPILRELKQEMCIFHANLRYHGRH